MSNYEFTEGLGKTPAFIGGHRLTPWETSAQHRGVLTRMMTEAAGQSTSAQLGVWGAGYCNDLDLKRLLDCFAEVHLVDIDQDALQNGVERQNCAGHSRLYLHGGIDLAGVYHLLLEYQQEPHASKLDEIVKTAKSYQPVGVGQFDVLASTCVLSQIILHVVNCVGEDHERFSEPMLAVRNRHLELMLEHLRVGGTGLFITDITSSDTLPEIAQPFTDLQPVLVQAIEQRNHFHGVNPFAIQNLFRTQEPFTKKISNLDMSVPWVWNASTRHYACVAFQFRKQAD